MLDHLYLIVSNWLWGVPFQVWRFKQREPDTRIWVAAATKARELKQEREVCYEAAWITSRRGTIILTDTKLVFGLTEITLYSVKKAILERFKVFWARGLVLKIATREGKHYQFGLNYQPAWERQPVLPLQVKDIKIKYSRFSIILRIITVLFLIWFVVNYLN